MTNVLKGIGARIDRIPADALDDAIDAFVVIAERNGGKMIRRKYQLTAKPTKRQVRGGVASVLMQGVPSGFWVWRETGTGEHEIRPRRRGKPGWKPGPMGGALAHPIWGPVIHKGASGQRRWTKTCTEADRAIKALWARTLDKAA